MDPSMFLTDSLAIGSPVMLLTRPILSPFILYYIPPTAEAADRGAGVRTGGRAAGAGLHGRGGGTPEPRPPRAPGARLQGPDDDRRGQGVRKEGRKGMGSSSERRKSRLLFDVMLTCPPRFTACTQGRRGPRRAVDRHARGGSAQGGGGGAPASGVWHFAGPPRGMCACIHQVRSCDVDRPA